MHRFKLIFLGFIGALAMVASGLESPTSDGPVSTLDEPSLRIPMMKKLPTIDGAFDENEWEDASAISGFWSSNVKNRPYPAYEHQAPHQIQSWVYAGYDREHLYIAYRMAVYPEKSWLKAMGRFPDVYNHPLYGLMRDDHIEIELRPTHDNTTGYKMGMFKWFVNPINVVADQHWSPKTGTGQKWRSQATVRAQSDDKYWTVEMKMPLKQMLNGDYAGKQENGQPIVKLPPPDGTTYRVWFKNGIGGAGSYVVLFDQHRWNTTKMKLVFDSQAVSFQVNDVGPMMEDIIDVKLSLKNHDARSQTVRMGFFVENAEGLIYSSYEDANADEGLIELKPGEVKKLRLKKKFPGISGDGNYFWFDIRTAGRPAKVLFQNRLAKFHSTDPPKPYHNWRKEKLDPIAKMRPAKKDFDFKYQYSPYRNRITAFVDKGIHGASDEAKRAVEAHLLVMKNDDDETEVKEVQAKFSGNFATFDFDVPELEVGEYKVALLLFDEKKRIVGEREPKPFYKGKFEWERNGLGLEDIVWAPFEALKATGDKIDTVKQSITIDPSGLPAQIDIKADPRELPLEIRATPEKATAAQLKARGRGPQLRAPLRFEVVKDGQRQVAQVTKPATVVREWKSEREYTSQLNAGGINMDLKTQYDCDGALTVKLEYGSDAGVSVDSLELVMDVAGHIDTRVGGKYGMLPTSGLELTLPMDEGVVWDSANPDHYSKPELFYSRFLPFFYLGAPERGFTFLSDSDEGFILDEDGSTVTVERNEAGEVTLRYRIVNHKATVKGKRQLEFAMFTHPAKNKEEGYRRIGWLDWRPQSYAGLELECLPNDAPWGIRGSDETFKHFLKRHPKGAPRLYINRNWINSGTPALAKGAYGGEWLLNSSARTDTSPIDRKGMYGQPWVTPGKQLVLIEPCESWEDYFVYWLERQIRIGKVPGWWWDELDIPYRTQCVASGQAYFRDPAKIKEQELPWQSNFASLRARSMLKRLAKLMAKNEVPNYTSLWATSCATFESYANSSEMVESAVGFSLSYDIDHMTRFPISMVRYAAGTSRSLVTRMLPGLVGVKSGIVMPGDNARLDRAVIGRALLHDVGLAPEIANISHFVKAVNILHEFGYFDESGTETIPYWRSGDICRYGAVHEEGFSAEEGDPNAEVYVTIHRRPYKTANGKTGYKAMFIIVNESDKEVRGRLNILDSERLLGGKNTLFVSEVNRDLQMPPSRTLARHWASGFAYHGVRCLKDLETGGPVTLSPRGVGPQHEYVKDERFGPLHIAPHDYRILYAHFDPEGIEAVKKQVGKARATWWNKHKETLDNTWWNHWSGEPGANGVDKKNK